SVSGHRENLRTGMCAIRDYEASLASQLLAGLAERPRFQVWGITDVSRLRWRVPTVAITLPNRSAARIAEHLARRQICVWDGNMYALALTERLGLEERGGFVRLGLVHYNTSAEIERLLRALDELV